jgi:hypothetical protein
MSGRRGYPGDAVDHGPFRLGWAVEMGPGDHRAAEMDVFLPDHSGGGGSRTQSTSALLCPFVHASYLFLSSRNKFYYERWVRIGCQLPGQIFFAFFNEGSNFRLLTSGQRNQ